MRWNEWNDGFDFEPYGKVPMSWEKVSLWKWLEMSENESPYQNEWIQWDMNELKWIERIEVKWVICRIWLDEPYGNGPMVDRRCPYQSDLRWVKMNVPIKMNGID